ncbi:teicoplanin resistance protein VanZ [Yoonia sp.]|uniref:teicoplanin resistance protein VanZ n=1 Tax=Yoonia sp. TaxID=2212373 RepID=UPI002E0217DE|nr:teicoplanin resistance protein VanZ [Yoonia sp.]
MIAPFVTDTILDKHKPRVFALGMTLVLAVIIAVLTLLPLSAPQGLPGTDKAHHLLGFAALTLPAALLYPRSLAIVLPCSLLFGGAIELIQPYVGRQGELADFVADVMGAWIGVGVGLALRIVTIAVLVRQRRRAGT